MLKKLILAAALTVGASMSHAATCTLGDCDVTGTDGQLLSNYVMFDVNDIIGDGVIANNQSGDFTFSGNFVNDTTLDGVGVAAFLVSTNQGAISNLFLNIVTPVGIAASYALAHDVLTTIALAGAGAPPQIIEFTLTGTATRGALGGDPDINLTIAPIPLPAGILLMGTALTGFGIMRRRRKG